MRANISFTGNAPSPEDRERANRDLAAVIGVVSREKGISIRLLVHQSRCRADAARARQMAMYLAHVVKGVSLATIGEAFGRDRTTVSYACGHMEDLRDDLAFDAELERLESLLLELEEKVND